MGITIGTDARANVPLYLKFIYGGSEVGWGQPFKVNGLTNSGEAIDGDYRISDMDVYFVDRYGSIFQNHFGNGTIGFGSSLQAIAYLGGTMEYQTSGIQTSWLRQGTAGAFTATVHTGRIYSISYKDRLIRLRSKSRMSHLGDLRWQHPVSDLRSSVTIYGSYAFLTGNHGTGFYGTQGFFELDQGKTRWKCMAYQLATSFGPDGYLSVNGFPRMSGRGTGTLITPSSGGTWFYPGTNSGGTNFYDVFEPVSLTGSYLGTLIGTINTQSEAREYGYFDLTAAEAARVNSSPGTYSINKSRFRSSDDLIGSNFHFLAPIVIEGSPKTMFETLISGAMVTPLFTSSDIDSTTLNESGSNTAFFAMQKKVWFKDGSVIDSLKDLFNTTQALFSVNTSDKFEFRTYGPKNLNTTIPSFGTNDIMSSEFNNYEDDYYNRFIVRFNWDGLSQSYGRVYEEKSSSWGISYDRPLIIESKFIINPNEASVITQRVKSKYNKTFPHINFTTNLNSIGLDIGTLLKVTDPNSGMSEKIVQVVGYRKNWDGKTIEFDCYDGETLYQRRGYAQWEGDSSLTNIVSGTSTSGWGTNGTVNNINTTIYGTQFVWW